MPPRALPSIWGIVNVTPDSFSDGGLFLSPSKAIRHGLALVEQGADVLDVGGESTRPFSREVPTAEEAERVTPVVAGLVQAGVPVPVSVDTRKSPVARAALDAGATIVNDVSAGTHDEAMFDLVAERGAGLVLMHMRGTPETMQEEPRYDDVVADVRTWLEERADAAEAAGVARERIVLDPGIGFGKTVEHNLEILRRLEELVAGEYPVLLGASRKSFLGAVTGREVDGRMPGSLACVARAAVAGVRAVRVHDVQASADLVRVWGRIRSP